MARRVERDPSHAETAALAAVAGAAALSIVLLIYFFGGTVAGFLFSQGKAFVWKRRYDLDPAAVAVVWDKFRVRMGWSEQEWLTTAISFTSNVRDHIYAARVTVEEQERERLESTQLASAEAGGRAHAD